MRLTDFLEPELILVDLEADAVEDAIGAMVDCLARASLIDDPDAVRDAVLERESSHTTALGNGVALPHATIAGLEEARVVVAIAPAGVPFGPVRGDGEHEKLFFLLLSPLEEAGTHIKLLARIVRLVRHPTFVDALLECRDPEAIIAEIEREDALHV